MNQTAQIIKFEKPIVKADLDTGYDRLAHDITNTLASNPASLSGCEYQVVFAIIGKTYRWQKKSDWIANSQLCDQTEMSKAHISKTIKSLIAKNVITRNGREIGLNNVVSEWGIYQKPAKVNQSVNNEKLSNQLTKVNQSVSEVVQSVNNSCPIRPPQKKEETITKETITKESVFLEPEQKPKKVKLKASIPNVALPNFVNRELFDNYLEVRLAKKYLLSDVAIKLILSRLNKFNASGHDVNQSLEDAILGEWKTIYEPKKNQFQSRNKVQPENFAQTNYGTSTFTGDF
jgi:phage replication O-like protein O